MKRAIKYHSIYESDGAKFSDISTRYEVLPYLVEDSAGIDELREIAQKEGIKTRGVADAQYKDCGYSRTGLITHSLIVVGKAERDRFRKTETSIQYLGFITLKEHENIKAVVNPGKLLTPDQRYAVLNEQLFGVDNVVEIDGQTTMIMQSHNYGHDLKLMGYDQKAFEKACGVKEHAFSDSVSSCEECGEYDYQDNGYVYNFRMHPSGGHLGVNCGCFAEASKSNFESFVGDTSNPMDKDAADELENEGKIERVETFIGGMTDGRGGRYDGKSTREGDPSAVLKEYQTKEPKSKFLFVHEESGQFQTYFSIARVVGITKAKVS